VAVVLGVLAVRQRGRADQKADEAQGAALAQTAVAVGAAALALGTLRFARKDIGV